VIFRSITSHDVARRVAGGEADFGTVHSQVDLAGLEAEPLMTAEIVCILPRSHALAAKASISLHDLMPHPLISYRPGTPIGTRIANAFQASGLTKPIDVQTSLSSTACSLSAQGTGIALTDPFAVMATDFPSLVVRAVRPRIAIGVDLLFSRENPSSGIAMKLVEHVRAVAAEMAASIAQLTGAPQAAGRRPSPASKRRTANGQASGRAREPQLAGGA
jgi:DNA-binding transcriptional LysR family regulator